MHGTADGMIPDPERVLYTFLTGHAAVEDLGTRFVGRTPQETTFHEDGRDKVLPWVRVTLLDARNASRAAREHLIDAMVQLDVYAGSQADVLLHARTIRAALNDDLPGTQGDVVVTAVRFAGMLRNPDTDFEPARERVILTCEAWMRPA